MPIIRRNANVSYFHNARTDHVVSNSIRLLRIPFGAYLKLADVCAVENSGDLMAARYGSISNKDPLSCDFLHGVAYLLGDIRDVRFRQTHWGNAQCG